MLALTHENGVIQIAVPDTHAQQALALFSTALAAAKITEVEVAHGEAVAASQPKETIYEKYPHSVKFLAHKEAGDIIVNYIMDKAERTYGNRYPYQMQRFFRALEKATGVDINREHKKRLYLSGKPHHRGHSPLRKIEAAIEVIGAEEIYTFAKAFNFVANE